MCTKFHTKIIIFPGIMEGGHNAPPPIRVELPKRPSCTVVILLNVIAQYLP